MTEDRFGDSSLTDIGRWWLPTDPASPVAGQLTYRNADPLLDLDGGLPGVDINSPLLTLHGQIQDTPVTLERAAVTTEQSGWSGVQKMTLRPWRVVVGRHFDPALETFSWAQLRYTHLDDWVASRHFGVSRDLPGTVTATLTAVSPLEVPLAAPLSGQIRVAFLTASESRGEETRSVSIKQRTVLVIRPSMPTTLDGFWLRYARPLLNLLTTLTGVRNYVTEFLVGGDLGPDKGPVTVFEGQIHNGADATRLHTSRMLATLPEFGLERVPRWLAEATRMGPVAEMALSALHDSSFMETRLMTAASAAEGVHRRYFPQSRRMPKDDARRMRREILGSVDSRFRDALAEVLAGLGDPTYRTRLTDLVQYVDGALDDVVSNADRWATRAKDARNLQAHQLVETRTESEHELDESPEGADNEEGPDPVELYVLTHSLAFCVLAVLLRRCGVKGAQLRTGLGRLPEYHNLMHYANAIQG